MYLRQPAFVDRPDVDGVGHFCLAADGFLAAGGGTHGRSAAQEVVRLSSVVEELVLSKDGLGLAAPFHGFEDGHALVVEALVQEGVALLGLSLAACCACFGPRGLADWDALVYLIEFIFEFLSVIFEVCKVPLGLGSELEGVSLSAVGNIGYGSHSRVCTRRRIDGQMPEVLLSPRLGRRMRAQLGRLEHPIANAGVERN